ncbi:hypothetical protein ACP70R_031704 [Stipagrostis hirtigluma subsp. patula]
MMSLPSALVIALGKDGSFAECLGSGTRRNLNLYRVLKATGTRRNFKLYRVFWWALGKYAVNAVNLGAVTFFLPSAFLALGKVFAECAIKSSRQTSFAGQCFAETLLPSVTLGKAFAECILGFAECLGHSANSLSPVVHHAQTPLGHCHLCRRR